MIYFSESDPGCGPGKYIITNLGLAVSSLNGDASAEFTVTLYTAECYTKPQYRISVYLVGVATAMLWHMKMKHHPKFQVSVEAARFLMAGALAIIFWIILGSSSGYQFTTNACDYYQVSTPEDPCGSNWTLATRAIYIGFSRVGWGVSLAVIVLLCAMDRGELVQVWSVMFCFVLSMILYMMVVV